MAHYALQKLHMRANIFVSMPKREQAFTYASTLIKIEDEKKEQAKLKNKGRRK